MAATAEKDVTRMVAERVIALTDDEALVDRLHAQIPGLTRAQVGSVLDALAGDLARDLPPAKTAALTDDERLRRAEITASLAAAQRRLDDAVPSPVDGGTVNATANPQAPAEKAATPQSAAHEFIIWATENEGAGSAAVVDWTWFAEIARKYDPEFTDQFWPRPAPPAEGSTAD